MQDLLLCLVLQSVAAVLQASCGEGAAVGSCAVLSAAWLLCLVNAAPVKQCLGSGFQITHRGPSRTYLCSASAVTHWPEFVYALC